MQHNDTSRLSTLRVEAQNDRFRNCRSALSIPDHRRPVGQESRIGHRYRHWSYRGSHGALAFTIPDLIGVGIGYLIGTGLIGDDADQTDFSEIWKKFCESVASVLNFLKKAFVVGLFAVCFYYFIGAYTEISHQEQVKVEKQEAERREIESTPKDVFYNACYFQDDAEACGKYARKFPLDSSNFIEALKHACFLNHRDSCTNLTARLIVNGRYKEAENYIPLMCKLNESDCMQIAYILKQYKNEDERQLAILTFKEVLLAYPESKHTKSFRKALSELQ